MSLQDTAQIVRNLIEQTKGNTQSFKWALINAGAVRLGSGSYKTAYRLGDAVVKWRTRCRTLTGAVANKEAINAVNEKFKAPDNIRPYMADTIRVEGVIIQEKATTKLDWKDYEKVRKEFEKKILKPDESIYEYFNDFGMNNCGLREDGSLVVFDGCPKWARSY